MPIEDKFWIPPLAPKDQKKLAQTLNKGNKFSLSWTGFSNKTLWDWLQLLGTFAIPIIVVIVAANFSAQQNHDLQIAAAQRQQDIAISTDQQRQATLETYLDRIQDLLTNAHLSDPKASAEIRAIARARTLTALTRLDPDRKRIIIQFLYEANLINNKTGIDLRDADLSNANLATLNLSGSEFDGADLDGANFNDANLNNTYIDGANLLDATFSNTSLDGTHFGCATKGSFFSCTTLINADFRNALLNGTDFFGAHLVGARFDCIIYSNNNAETCQILSDVNFIGTSLERANLRGADLSSVHFGCATIDIVIFPPCTNLGGADLRSTNLSVTNLRGTDLRGTRLNFALLNGADLSHARFGCLQVKNNTFCTDLSGSNLSNANLSFADLSGINFSGVNLTGADLNHANLKFSTITESQLASVKSLHGTIMPDGSIHS